METPLNDMPKLEKPLLYVAIIRKSVNGYPIINCRFERDLKALERFAYAEIENHANIESIDIAIISKTIIGYAVLKP